MILASWRSIASVQTYLHLNIEHHNLALARLLLNGLLACAIAVATKLGVLDEAVLCDQILKNRIGDIVVVDTVLLSRPRGARRM